MGCWNETCGITQLPIKSGDPVALVFIVNVGSRNRNHSGFCYINDEWSPKFLPIFGTYNDYGGLENIQENWNTAFILDSLKHELVQSRLTQSANLAPRSYDEPKSDQLDLHSFTLEDVLDQIHEDRIWVQGVHGVNPMGWVMIHAWVWGHMTDTMDRDWQEPLTLAQVHAAGEAYYEAMSEQVQQERTSDDATTRILRKFRRHIMLPHTNPFNILADRGYHLDGKGMINGISSYNELLWHIAERGTPVSHEKVQHMIHSLAQFLVFRSNMTSMRKAWSPQTGKGGQHENLEAHLALHKLCVDHIQAQLDQYEQEDADWQDESDQNASVA
jgi:hypothetical protein